MYEVVQRRRRQRPVGPNELLLSVKRDIEFGQLIAGSDQTMHGKRVEHLICKEDSGLYRWQRCQVGDRFNQNIISVSIAQLALDDSGEVARAWSRFDNGPFRRLLQFVVELREVTRERGGEEFAALGTGAIVSFPAPAL